MSYRKDGDPFFKEAFNTIHAGRLELLMARIFGKKSVGRDGSATVTLKTWRGRIYVFGHSDAELSEGGRSEGGA